MAQIQFENKAWEVPESASPCESWTVFFEQLEKAFGKQNARMIWLATWQHNGSATCTTNTSFNKWASRNGIDVSNAATRTIASSSKMVTNIVDMGANMTTLIKYGLPVAGVGLLLIAGFGLYRSMKTGELPALAKMHPWGAAASAAFGKR